VFHYCQVITITLSRKQGERIHKLGGDMVANPLYYYYNKQLFIFHSGIQVLNKKTNYKACIRKLVNNLDNYDNTDEKLLFPFNNSNNKVDNINIFA
jgi:hypothetical protein